jgi:hypothetical protein
MASAVEDQILEQRTLMSTVLSDQQEITLVVIQILSATLSLIGSCTIVLKILRCLLNNKHTSPYDRIILGLSGCDILGGITYAVGPFLLPNETSIRVSAFGSRSTCAILGFLTQFPCMSAIWYNGLLSFYYLLTVRFQVRRTDFVKKYESWMHLSALFFPATAVTGYIFDWYDEQDLSMTCWAKYPIVGYIFGAIPMVITFLAVIINNIVIYTYVRKSLYCVEPQSRMYTTDDTESQESSEDVVGLTPLQKRLKREAATQGFLYVASFLMTSTPIFVTQILGGSFGYGPDDQERLYPLLILNALLLPLQGFFNVFIYVRPTYTRFKAANPNKAAWPILKQALFDPNIPKTISASMTVPTSDPSSNAFKRRRQSGGQFLASLNIIAEEKVYISESVVVENAEENAEGNYGDTPDSFIEGDTTAEREMISEPQTC